MTNEETRSTILRKYGVHESDLLGRGMEAEAYRYDEDKVLKIYNRMSSYTKQLTLQRFYDSIQPGQISYELPRIYQIMEENGTLITIEKRMKGTNMKDRLSLLNQEQLISAMKVYLSACLELRSVQPDPRFEGYRLFHDEAIPASQQKDWNHLLKSLIINKQPEVENYLSRDVVNYQHKFGILLDKLSPVYQGSYSIIHGDFYPGNLLVNEKGEVTGLIDFGLMTMYGDFLFDVALGWVFFDMYDELKAGILESCLKIIIQTLGEEVKSRLYQYVLIYSVYSANFYADDCSDGHYEWCVQNLNNDSFWEVLEQGSDEPS